MRKKPKRDVPATPTITNLDVAQGKTNIKPIGNHEKGTSEANTDTISSLLGDKLDKLTARLDVLEAKVNGMKGGRPPKTQVNDLILQETDSYTVFKDGKVVYKH